MIRVSIPCYQKVESDGESFTAYQIEVFQNGRLHTLYKRYSEFEEMHKQVKKVISTPDFPPKKVLKWQPKVIEQRRVILEQYLQGVLDSESIPRCFFKFLDVQLARTGSFDHNAVAGAVNHGFLYFTHQYYHDILSEPAAAHPTKVYNYPPIVERQMSERMSAAAGLAIQKPCYEIVRQNIEPFHFNDAL